MPLRLSLRELEVFVAVADEGTVTAAASAVALTQSAASQALAALEEGLGARLFDRIGRRLLLNAQGRRLLPPARALLSNALALQDLLGDPEAVHLRLGASTTIGNYLLPPLLALWRQRHPQARIDLLVANTADVVEAVASLQVDAGYIEGPSHHPDLVIEPWRQDRLVGPTCEEERKRRRPGADNKGERREEEAGKEEEAAEKPAGPDRGWGRGAAGQARARLKSNGPTMCSASRVSLKQPTD